MATDSAAAHRRRLRSSNTGDTAAYLATIVASSSTLRCIEPSRPQIAEDGKLIYVSVLRAVGSWKAAAAIAAALSALGPLGTLLGGILGAVGGWFVVDFLAVEADKRWNRDDLEQELVALIDERRAEVEAVMSAATEARSRAFDAVCMPRALDEDELEPLGPVTPSEITNRR